LPMDSEVHKESNCNASVNRLDRKKRDADKLMQGSEFAQNH
jgi:hypothetical protein